MNSNQRTLAIIATIAVATLILVIVIQHNLHNEEMRRMAHAHTESKFKTQYEMGKMDSEIAALKEKIQKVHAEKAFKNEYKSPKPVVS